VGIRANYARSLLPGPDCTHMSFWISKSTWDVPKMIELKAVPPIE
jgi:hypothetical protein